MYHVYNDNCAVFSSMIIHLSIIYSSDSTSYKNDDDDLKW